jgi:CRISPR-associated exonuclease Cas4
MSWYLTVTDLKQWAYCPRVVFFSYCMPRLRPMTFKMEAGLDAHEDEKSRERRRTGQLYGLTEAERIENVRIQSDALGLSALIDLVLRQEDQVWPVEYKLSRRTEIASHFKLQLAAYGLLLEEAWSVRAPEGFLYSLISRRAERVSLTTRLRNRVLSTVGEIRNMVEEERLPPPTNKRARCVNCEFRRFCNDVF